MGWGFQLQSPAVVAALAALFTLIGLNLAGVFEFGIAEGENRGSSEMKLFHSRQIGLSPRRSKDVLSSYDAANRTLTVTSPQTTTTFGGIISGTAGGLTKVGNGILVLTPQTTGALSASGAASNATVSGSADLTLSAAAAAGIAVGMPVSGPGIAFGTTVASVAGSVVTLSKNAVATAGNGTFAFGTTQTYVPSSGASGTSSITVSLAEAANLVVGSTVTGVGVAASSTVTAVDTATGVVTLNNALTAAVTGQNLTFGGATATASFNDYAGTTTVSGGLLRLGNLGALPSTTALVVLSGGTLELQASTTVASLAGDSSTTGGLITASGTSGTIQLNVNGSANTAFGGAITNNVGSTFNFNKQGSGTLTLGGPNTFTGATTVSGGTLTTLAGSLAGTSGVTVNGAILTAADFNSGATLALNATGRATISGAGQNVGAVTNANATDANALNFTATTGTITLASLAGAGKTRFGAAADITGGISEGTVTVVGALTSAITGGTVNGTGVLLVELREVGAATVLARIIALVEAAQGGKLPVQALVDRITAWFVPAVMAAATLFAWLSNPYFGAMALVAVGVTLLVAIPLFAHCFGGRAVLARVGEAVGALVVISTIWGLHVLGRAKNTPSQS